MPVAELQLVTFAQAAKYLSLHHKTVRRWGKEGRIKVIYIAPGRPRIPLTEIERLAAGLEDCQ